MTKTHIVDTRSEKGMALIVVLLLMAVLSGLATGFAMNGQVESAMAVNEQYYSGARAAAEAGINRATAALRMEEDVNLLAGVDDLVDANPAAAVNLDNGDVDFMLAAPCPCAVDGTGLYSYTIDVFDDDDPALYGGAVLSAAQLAAMSGEGNAGLPDPFTDHNTRLILRATGFGPSNTRVTVSRLILTTIIPIPGATLNPAIIVDGDLNIDGNLNLRGPYGSVHANGDLNVDGASAFVEKDATASGEFTHHQNFAAGGTMGGGYASLNLPTVVAADFRPTADFILKADGSMTFPDGSPCVNCFPNASDWDHDGTQWEISGNSAPTGYTFFVEGTVEISGSPKNGSDPIQMTLIATGTIKITGNPKMAPDACERDPVTGLPIDPLDNPQQIQFITDGDLILGGTTSLDDSTEVEGQIFVKEQMHMHGNPKFQGRIIVQNESNVFDDVVETEIDGTPTITYNGTLPGFVIPPTSSYTYNVTGWIEQ
jgi:cytoskeletal protein CcmA (bactofilin family)